MTERRHEPRRFPWQVRDSGVFLLVAAAGVVRRDERVKEAYFGEEI